MTVTTKKTNKRNGLSDGPSLIFELFIVTNLLSLNRPLVLIFLMSRNPVTRSQDRLVISVDRTDNFDIYRFEVVTFKTKSSTSRSRLSGMKYLE